MTLDPEAARTEALSYIAIPHATFMLSFIHFISLFLPCDCCTPFAFRISPCTVCTNPVRGTAMHSFSQNLSHFPYSPDAYGSG